MPSSWYLFCQRYQTFLISQVIFRNSWHFIRNFRHFVIFWAENSKLWQAHWRWRKVAFFFGKKFLGILMTTLKRFEPHIMHMDYLQVGKFMPRTNILFISAQIAQEALLSPASITNSKGLALLWEISLYRLRYSLTQELISKHKITKGNLITSQHFHDFFHFCSNEIHRSAFRDF